MLDMMAIWENPDQGGGSLSEEICGDMMYVLGVPRVPGIFQALESFKAFTSEAWTHIRLNMMTDEALELADMLRSKRLEAAPPSVDWRNLYSPGSFEYLRSLVNNRYEVNPKLLLVLTAWLESLSGRPVRGSEVGEEPLGGNLNLAVLPSQIGSTRFDLYENALSSSQLLNEIALAHPSLGVPEDYLALARYPEFLRIQWGFLRPHLHSEEYRAIKQQLKAEAAEGVHKLPFEVNLERLLGENLRSWSGQWWVEQDRIRLITQLELIQDLVAGLILEMNYIRFSLK
jgi:hypothetical protein